MVTNKNLDPIVQLAKDTVETYVRTSKVIKPGKLTPEMEKKAGVFVSIHKKGALRGCIGTFEPTKENIAQEIISNAINSATHDPRFDRIRESELDDLDYSVDILTSPEPIKDISKLDPKKKGVIIQCGYRRGLLLPDLEGVDTVDQQIAICRSKAGIESEEPINVYCFEVRRHK
jgi:AmmeMemoRadiSam system protein A